MAVFVGVVRVNTTFLVSWSAKGLTLLMMRSSSEERGAVRCIKCLIDRGGVAEARELLAAFRTVFEGKSTMRTIYWDGNAYLSLSRKPPDKGQVHPTFTVTMKDGREEITVEGLPAYGTSRATGMQSFIEEIERFVGEVGTLRKC